jgi:hypothetical protein
MFFYALYGFNKQHLYIKIKTNTLYVLYALYGFNKQTPVH